MGDLASRLTQERSSTMRYHLSEDNEVLRVDGQAGIAEVGHFNSTLASPVYSSFPERSKETHIHQSSNPRWLPENTEYWPCLLNKFFQITPPTTRLLFKPLACESFRIGPQRRLCPINFASSSYPRKPPNKPQLQQFNLHIFYF